MSTLRSIASTQPEEVAVSVARVSRQIAICVLLTALNVAVAALNPPGHERMDNKNEEQAVT